MTIAPLVLDFDGSVRGLPGAMHIPLHDWQERIRFASRWSHLRELSAHLASRADWTRRCVFTGSGDYHHLTLLLLQLLPNQRPLRLVVCDNHPDNMRYPFGVHCGSWVYWASRLPNVERIDVIGITSSDISARHALENHWGPLASGRVTYWSIGADARWLRWIGATGAGRDFPDAHGLMQAFVDTLEPHQPVYLSIDKDVLAPEVVRTNWDQGRLEEAHLHRLIQACDGRLVGADVTGEVSAYRYQSIVKRWLSAADGQSLPSPDELSVWQEQHAQVNRRLRDSIGRSLECTP